MTDDPDKIYIESEEEDAFEEKAPKKTVRVLVFSLGDENYCVDVREAKEVSKMPEITRVPNVPSFIVGVANMRGEILSILDLHYFFGVDQKGKTKDLRVIVTDVSKEQVGLMVDQVKDTLEIEEDRIQEPLATLKGKLAGYTKGQIPFGENILIFLDLAKILQCEEIRDLKKGEAPR
jgi:purine-binding chemotaxis protein CheW